MGDAQEEGCREEQKPMPALFPQFPVWADPQTECWVLRALTFLKGQATCLGPHGQQVGAMEDIFAD